MIETDRESRAQQTERKLQPHNKSSLELFNEDGSYTRHGAWSELSKLIILVPNNPESLPLLAAAKNMKEVSGFTDPSQPIALLCRLDIETHNPPKKHNNNSDAGYAIDMYRYEADDGKENVVFASDIPPDGMTSVPPHTHGIGKNNKNVIEHIFIIKGDGTIGGGEVVDRYYRVEPNTHHVIKAKREGIRVLILLENVKDIPNSELHIYRHTDIHLFENFATKVD